MAIAQPITHTHAHRIPMVLLAMVKATVSNSSYNESGKQRQ